MARGSAMRIGLLVLGLVLPAAAVLAQPGAQPDDGFYRGKQLSFAVASSAGGGFDSYARLLARHIGKFVPGNPGSVVTNMSGAGGHLVGRYISEVAPRDGTWIALVLPGTITGALYVDKAKLQYDPSKLIHLGSASNEVDVCFVRHDSGIKTIADAQRREIVLGSTADGAATKEQAAVLNNLVGTRFRLVSGYPGTREIMLALEKNEVSGVCGMSLLALGLQRPQWIETGFVRPIVQNHAQGSASLTQQGVPRAVDLARSAEDRQVLELIYSQQSFRRPFVMAAGVPPARAALLRKALIAALKDPELLAEAQKMRLDIDRVSGEELQALVEKVYAAPPHIIARAADALIYRPPP
jgi:tripartite-type tricarboxylate transporter receptor subunit TctC